MKADDELCLRFISSRAMVIRLPRGGYALCQPRGGRDVGKNKSLPGGWS